jgi:uncharacterized protein (TIGR00255 family)
MINSMTGYGSADGHLDGVCYGVEIKAVNNRYLKSIIKLPDNCTFLEDEIDRLLRQSLSRGTINFVLRMKDVGGSALFEIDEGSLRSIIAKLRDVSTSIGVSGQIDLAGLLELPGIVRPLMPDEEQGQRIKDLVLDVSRQAIEKLKTMRAAEGRFLEDDLNKHCEVMRVELDKIRQRIANVVKDYAGRLRKRVDELLAEAKLRLDEVTLAREVAVLADRSDIAEEISRLDAHLQQFAQICRTDGQAGRRLDFLSQEMLREINTIASKAADAEIARSAVDIKCMIERLKEQIQNVE